MSTKKRLGKKAREELVKTQVLNIEELRRVARYERKTSKKPAVMFALLGSLLILVGVGSQSYLSYTELLKTNKEMQKDIAERKEIEKKTDTISEYENTMICQMTTSNSEKLVKTEASFAFYFDSEKKLQKEYKIYTAQKISGLMENDSELTSQYNAYKDFENSGKNIKGYSLTIVPIKSIGFQAVSKIDFKEIDMATIPSGIQNNPNVKADFELNETAEHIKERAESLGYTCTMNNEN